jgi:hypothetical protein
VRWEAISGVPADAHRQLRWLAIPAASTIEIKYSDRLSYVFL